MRGKMKFRITKGGGGVVVKHNTLMQKNIMHSYERPLNIFTARSLSHWFFAEKTSMKECMMLE